MHAHTNNNKIIYTQYKTQVKGQQKEVNGVSINSWMGVPYAASPTGDLRWKPVRFINGMKFGNEYVHTDVVAANRSA